MTPVHCFDTYVTHKARDAPLVGFLYNVNGEQTALYLNITLASRTAVAMN